MAKTFAVPVAVPVAIALLAWAWLLLGVAPAATAVTVPVTTPLESAATFRPAAATLESAVMVPESRPVTGTSETPSVQVQWDGPDLVIDAQATPLTALITALARQTGSELVGESGVLNASHPVTLRWRGRDALQVWALLLEGQASYAAHCMNMACRVWLLGTVKADASTTLAALHEPVPNPPHAPGAPADPPGLFPAD